MQIKRVLQFPGAEENVSGLTLNSNNGYLGRGFDGLDRNIKSLNDVRIASTKVPHLESKYENLATPVLNANSIISSNKLNTANDKKFDCTKLY